MAIITKPTTTKPQQPSAESFIGSAPDATAASSADASKPKHVLKGKKIQITLTIAPALLEQVDAQAARFGLSRAAVINLAIHQGMEKGINVEGHSRD